VPTATTAFQENSNSALEPHDRGAGNDAESGVADEHGDQFVGHAVGEVVLLWISREIFEGEHGE
jgi:hypothetical protein